MWDKSSNAAISARGDDCKFAKNWPFLAPEVSRLCWGYCPLPGESQSMVEDQVKGTEKAYYTVASTGTELCSRFCIGPEKQDRYAAQRN